MKTISRDGIIYIGDTKTEMNLLKNQVFNTLTDAEKALKKLRDKHKEGETV